MKDQGTIVKDQEVVVLSKIAKMLDELTPAARDRVLAFVKSKYETADKFPIVDGVK